MLVLSRRESERIKLGDSIVVTVVRVTGDRVRLGIEAPANVVILRDELPPHEAPPSSQIASAPKGMDRGVTGLGPCAQSDPRSKPHHGDAWQGLPKEPSSP